MFGGLRGNLLGAIVTTTAALVFTIILLEDPLVEYRATRGAQSNLLRTAEEAARQIRQGEAPDLVADRLGAQAAAHLTIVDDRGRIVGDTAYDGSSLAEATFGPQAQRAAEEARGAERGYALIEHPDLPRRLSVVLAAGPELTIRASRPMVAVDATREGMRELLLVGGVMAVAIAALLAVVLTRTVVHPIRSLTQVADALAAGDLTVRTRSKRKDELGTLGRTFDHMADQLAERLKTLRAEEARLRTILDAMVEAVFVTDRDGTIVLTNTALERLVEGEAQGRTAVDAIRSPELHEAVRGARKGRPASVDLETEVSGERRALAAHVAPLPDRAGVVAVIHDVTNLKRADRIRRDFVANASHELRTPLTAVRGFAETLRDGAVQDPDATVRFAEMIVKHTLRLQRLVDDLLALSRSESPDQSFELGPIDVDRLLADTVKDLEAQAEEKSIDLIHERGGELPAAYGNDRALDQIVVNLVDNALKYTPAGGTVRVRARAVDQLVAVEVEDTGPGIPEKYLGRIFERFYRVDKGRSRDVGGTGLGLSIVKHLALRMGAEVDVESEVGRGTTFRVLLEQAAEPWKEAAS